MNMICIKKSRVLFLTLLAAGILSALTFFCSDDVYASNDGLIGANIQDGQLLGYYGEGGDIVIPNTVTIIGEEAFKDNDNVTSVTIPGSVQQISYAAFSGCTELEEIIFSDPVDGADMIIRLDAFVNCPKLTKIEIPATAVYVTANVFKDCTSLKEIRVHEDNPYYFTDENGVLFGPWVDYGEPQYEDEYYALTAYPCGRTGGYTVPDEVDGKKINQVWASAFRTAKGLTSISFEEGITILGGNAFEETGLTDVVIPDTVTSIGSSLFENCENLQEVTLPEGVTSVPFACFQGCSSLSRVNLPNSVTNFETYAFKDCTSLTSMILPPRLSSLTLACFEGCTNLQRVVIPPSVINFPNDEYAGYYDPFEDSPRSLVIYVEKDSAAEKWAYNNVSDWGYTYEILDDFSDLSGIGCVNYYLMDMSNKVRLEGSFEIGTTLKVTPLFSGEEYDAFREKAGESALRAYRIELLPEDAETEGTLRLGIGLPADFTKDAELYSYSSGTVTELDSSYSSRTVSADISSTGCFALIDSTVADSGEEGEVTGITLSRTSAELSEGQQIQLSATVQPDCAADKSVTWSSSDTKVAVVNNRGIVSAVSAGTADITATTHNGISAVCRITVTGQTTDPTDPPTEDGIRAGAALYADSASAAGHSSFSLSLSEASSIATVEVSFETTSSDVTVTGKNGFSAIGDIRGEWTDGSYHATAVLAYLNGSRDLFSTTGTQVIAQIVTAEENAALKITGLTIAGWNESEEVAFGTVNGISPDEATSTAGADYDVNGDGSVDQLDLTEAVKYYRIDSGDDNWQDASRCDFVADGVISVDDFVEIWLHYTSR